MNVEKKRSVLFDEHPGVPRKISISTYFLSFIFSVIIAILLLLVCASFPAAKVNQHVRDSAIVLAKEGDYPSLSDRSDASVLDNFTDATMLMESMSTSIYQPETILTNPKFIYADTLTESLLQYTENNKEQPTSYYARYWMGFRVFLRPALTFLTYQEIKLYNALLFFTLFSAVIVSISKKIGTHAAMTFAISIILVRPHIICNSLQFSNCFLIAFIFMLLVPRISNKSFLFHLFFMEIGIATMYFDFYTTPFITFALPAMYLWLLQKNNPESYGIKTILSTFAAWGTGYFLMWVAKLVLTDMFTSVDGVKTGFSAMGNWTIRSVTGQGITITPFVAFYRIISSIVADFEGFCIWGAAFVVLFVFLFSTRKNRKKTMEHIKENKSILIFLGFTILWFLITYKPTAVHYYFQYRTIVVAFWSFLLLIFQPSHAKHTSAD